MDGNKDYPELFGRMVEMNILLATALAEAFRHDENPREMAYTMIPAAELQITELAKRFKHVFPAEELTRFEEAARENTLLVGSMTDSILSFMGEEPRQGH